MIKIDIQITIMEEKEEDSEKFIDRLTQRIKSYLEEHPEPDV